ncbi:MAG: hypothetical protein KDA79_03530 [Planctomycetaceae bacterium]|nr:hypothetical protein [Planctomycetaceae bacterium]
MNLFRSDVRTRPFRPPGATAGLSSSASLDDNSLRVPRQSGCQSPDGTLHVLTASRHELHPNGVPVFNFEVEDYHSYFVSAHGTRGPPVLVHNADYAADDLLPILNKRFVPRQFTPQELRSFAQAEYERLLAAGMSRREIGPAIAIVQDAKTGQLSAIYRNDLQGVLPANLSEQIAVRLSTSPEYIKTRGLGSHAEIYAADELLKARPGATLGDLRIYTIETQMKSLRGQFKPPCPHCRHLLDGAEFLQ